MSVSFILSALFTVFFMFISLTSADELPVLEDVIVTSRQTGRSLGVTGSGIAVISRDDIAAMEISTIPELFATLASINLIERGTTGSQADLSIKGSSIEGVLLLVNGIRVHDPQTGHFTMDIPIDISAVERVEVMTGGGSSQYGTAASGGVINIVMKKDENSSFSGFGIGSFKSGKVAVSLAEQKEGVSFLLNAHGGKSDGYKPDSDLEYAGITTIGAYGSTNLAIDWNMGYLKKSFGAGNYYSPYPSFEKTTTIQGGINARYLLDDRNLIRIRAGSRGHGDDFILIRNQPDFYRNTHYNRCYSFAAEYLTDLRHDTSIMVGNETERLGITSPGLGNHADSRNAVYGELSVRKQKSNISLTMRLDRNTRKETIFSPGLGIMVPLGHNYRFRLRTEKSFRSPTYTELYYVDPANSGNSSLRSERSLWMEAGVDMSENEISTGISGFVRKSTDVLDWIRYTEDKTWFAVNHGSVFTRGIEVTCLISLAQSWKIRFNSTLLNQDVTKRKGIESKYALNPLEKSAVAVLSGHLVQRIKCAVAMRYEKMHEGQSRTPVSVKISRKIRSVKAIFSVNNIFNEWYEELPGLRAPGRWFNFELQLAGNNTE